MLETTAVLDDVRHDWTTEAVERYYRLPLTELVYQAQSVHRRPQQIGRHALEELGQRVVRGGNVPVPVERDSGERLLRFEHDVDCLARRGESGITQGPFLEHRREARGDEERVALAQRDLELLGEVEQHLTTRQGAAGLEER